MKQFEKIHSFIKNPRKYGIRKNSRVYTYICVLACNGIAQTGYSNRRTKHVETNEVAQVLNRLGVSFGSNNIAPRGGACGERVFLVGKVKKDCLKNCKKFVAAFLCEHPKKTEWNAKDEFIKTLQK